MCNKYHFTIYAVIILYYFSSCSKFLSIEKPAKHESPLSGTAFYEQSVTFNWKQRDSFFLEQVNQGNIPDFFFRFVEIKTIFQDSTGKKYNIRFYCSPDYVATGHNSDWARVPLTPLAAQVLADKFQCFLPTRKMVDLIYQQSKVKLSPVPMYAYRDSTITMWQHHLIIEGQRKGRSGLISGIKKDVVICSDSSLKGKQNRVAIYGWHKTDGKPIQPLYTGHVNWYADYSHGIRLIYQKIKVNNIWMDYTDFFNDPVLSMALSDEKGKLLLRY